MIVVPGTKPGYNGEATVAARLGDTLKLLTMGRTGDRFVFRELWSKDIFPDRVIKCASDGIADFNWMRIVALLEQGRVMEYGEPALLSDTAPLYG